MISQGEWEHDDETGKSTCSKLCDVTGEVYSVTVDTTQYHQWHYGRKFIQEVMPELTPSEREFLISGNTPAEWDEIFGDFQDYDE